MRLFSMSSSLDDDDDDVSAVVVIFVPPRGPSFRLCVIGSTSLRSLKERVPTGREIVYWLEVVVNKTAFPEWI